MKINLNFSFATYVMIFFILILLFLVGTSFLTLHSSYDDLRIEKLATPTPIPDISSVLLITRPPDYDSPSPQPQILKIGSKGDMVAYIQTRLKELGFYKDEIDGQFGLATKEAVMSFQEQHALIIDGLVGELTLEMIKSSNAKPFLNSAFPTDLPNGNLVNNSDFEKDYFLILINKQHPIDNNFQAKELVYLKDIIPNTLAKVKGSEIRGNKQAVEALIEMFVAAHNDGVSNWQISAGHRSINYQNTLFNSKVQHYLDQGFSRERARSAASVTVALPGSSEHHSGLAFDVTVPGETFVFTPESKWLSENCWDFGFIIRYPEGKQSITGFEYEPWHIRFVGTDHSTKIRDNDLTLEEYLELNISYVSFE